MKADEEKILDVAYTLFRQKSVRSISLQQIARASGVSVWDVTSNFKSKRELVLAVVKHLLNKKSAYLLINSSLCPSAVSELTSFFKFVDDNLREFGTGILEELRRYHPHALDQLQELVDMKLKPHLQRIIERGVSEGFYREDLDHQLYVPTYFYVLRSVLENESLDWTATMRLINHINDVFFHGVLNVKGMRI